MAKVQDNRQAITDAYNAYTVEADLFWEKGNKSAGARARKALMDLKNAAHTERANITDAKNTGK